MERLSQVHPVLSRRVQNLIAQLETEGYIVRVTRGISTVAQQDAIWQKGRDADGNVVGETFTDAKGTESNHVLGYAADLAIMDSNGEPDWKSTGFDRIVDLAPNHGLRSGASWGDRPHVELEEVPAKPSEEAQSIYIQAGVAGVWSELSLG